MDAAFIASIQAGCLYLLKSETEESARRKKIMKAILSLVELVGDVPPTINVLLPFAALTLYVEKKDPYRSEYLPYILECIHSTSNSLAVSMPHLKEECDQLAKYVAELKEEDHTALRKEILDFKDKLVAVLEDEHEEEGEDEHEEEGEDEHKEEGEDEHKEEGENEHKEEGEDEESMIIEEEEKEEEAEVAEKSVSEEVEDISDSDSLDQQLLKRVKRIKKSLTDPPPVASSSRDVWTSDESDDESDDDGSSEAAASSENTTKFYSAYGRNPKNRWSAQSVTNLLEGVNLYGEGKWTSICRSYTFPKNINGPKLKDKWRNLVKYKYVKYCGGKYVLN